MLDTGHCSAIDKYALAGVLHDDDAFEGWCAGGDDPMLPVIGALFRGYLDLA